MSYTGMEYEEWGIGYPIRVQVGMSICGVMINLYIYIVYIVYIGDISYTGMEYEDWGIGYPIRMQVGMSIWGVGIYIYIK